MKDIADTICAVSTPPGRSGLAVVRISGQETTGIVKAIFVPAHRAEPIPLRRAMLGRIVDPSSGGEIDEVIATCYGAPHSYTGEDMCEFSLHGSPVLVSALLDCLCTLHARIAEPGEFTMRAFLNGKMDLTQAEAIRDTIEAVTLYQAQVAARQRSGGIQRQLQPSKSLLIDVIAEMESAVEFEEEEPVLEGRTAWVEKLESVKRQLRDRAESYRHGRIVRDGISMAIVGRPNAGKSSLFNALLAQERSIVTEIPGTTRDLVSEFTSIGGIPIRLLDTAGIHAAGGYIERIGIDRSRQAIADADAILLVCDCSRPPSQEDLDLKEQLHAAPAIVVMSKSDLPSCWSAEERLAFAGTRPCIDVSAKTMDGVESLRGMILGQLVGGPEERRDGIMITNLRHCRCIEAAVQDIALAIGALRDGISEEYALVDLHRGLRRLGEITGEVPVEDLLGEIFARFCIGK